MIRIVPTGDLGLDVLTGGGWRLVKRFEERESACVVVRGGPGAGKSTLGIHVALELANALGGDVAVGCVEILPTEYVAQLQSTRPSLEAARIVQLPVQPAPLAEGGGPRVFIGLMTELDPARPDLAANLAALGAAVEAAGGKPTVFIVDSLIDGYGIGPSIDRIDADATIKFAVQGGYGLVLCEETISDTPSPWVFAADTVLQLGVESRERGRWIEVKKHRFGPSATGRHELGLSVAPHRTPEVWPSAYAWKGRLLQGVLKTHGWKYSQAPLDCRLVWDGLPMIDTKPAAGDLALVSSDSPEIASGLASWWVPAEPRSARTLVIDFDPLARAASSISAESFDTLVLPIDDGPARTLRKLVEAFAGVFVDNGGPNVGRVVLGDVGLLNADANEQWFGILQTFSTLVADTRWGVPIVMFDGLRRGMEAERPALVRVVDLWLRFDSGGSDRDQAESYVATGRWPQRSTFGGWKRGHLRQKLIEKGPAAWDLAVRPRT